MTDVVVREMNETEARALTERIKSSVEHVWQLLLEAHERKAWKVLAYDSWREYASAEFDISERQAYHLLDQAKINRELEQFCTTVQISDREARDIKPHIVEVKNEVAKRVFMGEDPEVVVPDVVAEVRKRVHPDQLGTRRRKAAPRAEALDKFADTLAGLSVALEGIAPDDLPDDAPVERWLREIDGFLKSLRKFRSSVRTKYGIAD